MERVLALGVAPSRIVYANPVRCRKMLEYSRDKGIEMLSADCASELHKIAAHHPKAKYNCFFTIIHLDYLVSILMQIFEFYFIFE